MSDPPVAVAGRRVVRLAGARGRTDYTAPGTPAKVAASLRGVRVAERRGYSAG